MLFLFHMIKPRILSFTPTHLINSVIHEQSCKLLCIHVLFYHIQGIVENKEKTGMEWNGMGWLNYDVNSDIKMYHFGHVI